jgi:hypothetical protein
MKKLELTWRLKMLALFAMRNTPDGYKGVDKMKSAIKLQDKLEKDFPEETLSFKDPRALTSLEEVKVSTLYLENNEVTLLKEILGTMPWTGFAIKEVAHLYDILDSAVDFHGN